MQIKYNGVPTLGLAVIIYLLLYGYLWYHIREVFCFICMCYFVEQHITIKTSTTIAIINKTGWVNSHNTANSNTKNPTNLPIAAIPE